MDHTCDALVLAAGKGLRFGGAVPKQFRRLGASTVVGEAAAAFLRHPAIRHVIVVAPPEGRATLAAALGPIVSSIRVVDGGATRQASARAGLAALCEVSPPDTVMIHDAARPFVSAALIARVANALKTADAVIPAIPVSDTIKRISGRAVIGTVPRDDLVRAQTPQGFRTELLNAAHAANDGPVTDDAAVMERAGHRVVWVDGEAANIKITVPDDLPSQAPTQPNGATFVTRVGQGFDVHRLGPGGPLILGGLTVDHDHHLVGHSDADVALHALTDALFGALGDGDIGHHFPPSDPTWRGAASDQFLAYAAERAVAVGRIAHLDLTIICERPKIGPLRERMRARIAEIAGVPVTAVSVKATTTERLGFPGRGEGIAAQAAATIMVPEYV